MMTTFKACLILACSALAYLILKVTPAAWCRRELGEPIHPVLVWLVGKSALWAYKTTVGELCELLNDRTHNAGGKP